MHGRVAWVRVLTVALVVLCLDQLTKSVVNSSILQGHRLRFLPGITLVNVHNHNYVDGVGFVGEELRLILTITAALALVASLSLLFYSSRHPKRQAVGRRFAHRVIWLPIGLLLGGSIGNLINRVSEGSVTDFINLKGSGLAFNLADLALITGAMLMLWLISMRSPGQASVNSGLSP